MCRTSIAAFVAGSAAPQRAPDRFGLLRQLAGAASDSLCVGGRVRQRLRGRRRRTATMRTKGAALHSSPIPVRPCPRQQPGADDMSASGRNDCHGDRMPQISLGGRKAKTTKYLALASTALISLGQPIAATAAEIWTGTASTDWFTAGNWNPAAVPTSSDDVTLNATFPNPTVINGANAAAHYLYLGTIDSYTGSLTIKGGATLASTAGFVGHLSNANGGAVSEGSAHVGRFAGSTGMVFVDGAGSTWTSSGSLSVGDFGSGTLAITHGGAVSNGGGVIGAIAGSTGMVFVDGAGSTWT